MPMVSRSKLFSWSKGQPSAEYHRTGGLLAIDTSVGGTSTEAILVSDAKSIASTARRRPADLNLTISLDSNVPQCLTPASARHNSALVNSASNLLAVVNDMMRSPARSVSMGPRTTAPEIHKPLPSRPRSVSLPSSPTLPVELPGSILLANRGFPSPPDAGSASRSTMRSVRSGSSLSASVAAKPSPSKASQHRKSKSEANASLQRGSRSRPSLISPSSTDSKTTTRSVTTNGERTNSNDSAKVQVDTGEPLQLSPLILEGTSWNKSIGQETETVRRDEPTKPPNPAPPTINTRQLEELRSTIVAQDQIISTLQAQFGRVRASHEAEVAALKDAHEAQVSTLKDYSRVLEEQQSQRTLHHASSNHLLLLLDTADPKSPSRESPAGSASTTSIRSFKSAFEQQTRSPHPSRDNPEMENLKRKLSVARRPEVGNRDVIRELNQYKQNNAALQKQIESLMAKLNQSKQSERTLRTTLLEVEKNCTGWQEKASKVDQLEKSALALQNTIDHLEYRLEISNVEKLDAEEALLNLQSQKSPFDVATPSKLQIPPALPNDRLSAHTSISTVFSTGSPTSHNNESQDPTTLSAFIGHIERLQEQLKQKELSITELRKEKRRLRQDYEHLEREYRGLSLQSDIQGQLLRKIRETDAHVEQLRTAIIDRESIIGEKSKSLRMAERQLEHHKLLLHAEIRRHATFSTLADIQNDPLPDLTTLASKEDIDRWIGRLQARLKKERAQYSSKEQSSETVTDDLKKEVDFYVREIIYYKLDIKGYKSDIKKLKHIATRMGSYGSRVSDLESPTPSICRSSDTPPRPRFVSETPRIEISNTSSPIAAGPTSIDRSQTPPPTSLVTQDPSHMATVKPTTKTQKHRPRELESVNPTMSHTPKAPSYKEGINVANEVDNVDSGISPRAITCLSPEGKKPMPPSAVQETLSDMATSFPLNTPASPKRHGKHRRSMSDSIIPMYAAPRTPDWSPTYTLDQTSNANDEKPVEMRGRSASMSDQSKRKLTPDRPPRPQYGLYESPEDHAVELSTSQGVDVLAKVIRTSPDRVHFYNDPDVPISRIPGPSDEVVRDGSSRSNFATSAAPSLRAGTGSDTLGTANIASSSNPRKLSTGSESSAPFIIGIGSPYNSTLQSSAVIAPITVTAPAIFPIINKCPPPKDAASTSKIGVGGTMASSVSPTAPISPTDASKPSFFSSVLPIGIAQPSSTTKSGSRTPSLSMSLGPFTMHRNHHNAEPTTPRSASGTNTGHSRSGSASGFSKMMMGKGKERTKKESISVPTPLTSPFDIDRGAAIGEAI